MRITWLCVKRGTVVKTGTPEEVFAGAVWLQEKQLGFAVDCSVC